ncbi:murein L,D-transpeptidase catalytic domain family protein [Bdellovibrio sp. SKB1291214]|uniref:murein L,D-transpeptidase catalytic domain family protein n=1 Tax=Bdellovibrio sp. SKB1291214 TaxID=1732569 RepID=UPI0020CF7485|nr:murein L,D-transpeptidase catalytic domain family protein [Bdellovibrio sp. SKB1291214]UYL07608.1 murein L,D-transpeptidase catalytic domain family protein [Bdellovibrio sp. SKB1291214]
MKVQFALVCTLLSLMTSAAVAAPSQAVYNKILAQGVPQDALNRMIHFLDENRGRSFQQSTYDCARWPDSIRPCDESERRPSTDVVTLESPQEVVIIDFTEASTTRRFYLIDLKTGDVIRYYVAHGKGTGTNYATKFSNIKDSKQTSLGFYLTGGVYSGSYGKTLRMYGLQSSNDQAYNRDIVLHGAWYVGEDFIKSKNPKTGQPFGRLGVSWGCPALSLAMASKVIPQIQKGSVVLHYHRDLMEAAMSGNEVSINEPQRRK